MFAHVSGDRYVFRVGRRVTALQQFDATADDIGQSIGLAVEVMPYGARATGTLDQLERFAAILDVKNTLDSCDPNYRRASIRAAERLRLEIAAARKDA